MSINDLIEEIYASTDEPLRYDQFMASWDQYVMACLATENVDSLPALNKPSVHTHFNCAKQILDRIGRQAASVQNQEVSAQQVVELSPGFAILVNGSGRLLASNQAAINLMPGIPRQQSTLGQLPFDAEALTKIQDWISEQRAGFLLTPCFINALSRASCLLVSPLDYVAETQQGEPAYLISSTDLHLDTATLQGLVEVYQLSDAEAQVALEIANGSSPSSIAHTRGVSINTVRTQIKRILKKTNARRVPDLVRMLCSFAVNFSPSAASARIAPDIQKHRYPGSMLLADGRRLAYVELGDPEGQPVLLCHNMLYGVSLTELALEACASKGWRIIAPSRPGFGASDLNASVNGAELVKTTGHDMRALLDHLGINKVWVMGHSAGSIYAQRFAIDHEDRTLGLLLVSHVPIWQEDFFQHLPRRQRLLARTTRYAPYALSFVTRAGLALIDAGREDLFLNALHHKVPADMQALRRPDIYAVIIEGLRHTVHQGSAAFCRDCPLVLTDWSEDARQLRVPVRLLHGRGDRVVTEAYLQPYLLAVPQARLTWVEGAGQYLPYSHWSQVLEQLVELQASAKN